MATMKAAVMREPGGPEVLKLETLPVPTPRAGEVLVRVKALRCCREGGLVCMSGIVGNRWSFDDFAPMEVIPTGVGLTVYSGGADDFMRMPFGELVRQVAAGTLRVPLGRTFRLDEIVEAHRCMEANEAGGKIVVLP